jgi:hypothetical protein
MDSKNSITKKDMYRGELVCCYVMTTVNSDIFTALKVGEFGSVPANWRV